jgi:membrane protease subunit HflC
MKTIRWIVLLVVAVGVTALVRSVVFVEETEVVMITQFGRLVRTIDEAGLSFKPPYQSALRIDRRLQIYDPLPSEFLTTEKKNLDLDVFVCWRVSNAKTFLESVATTDAAKLRIHDVVFSELGAAVGKSTLDDIVTTDSATHRLDDLMDKVTETCRDRLLKPSGIELVDVRLKRIGLPAQKVRESVFDRMRTERASMAQRYRAEGDAKANEIRAEADRDKTIALANAYALAEEVRGKGEAEATKIYADAHQADPEFYELTRTLQAYRKFLDEKTTIILSSDSELLKYLTRGAPAAAEIPATQPPAEPEATTAASE